MDNRFVTFLRAVLETQQRAELVVRLSRMDDHLLADIGLRRDQLESVILLPAASTPVRAQRREAASRQGASRPSLQGCG